MLLKDPNELNFWGRLQQRMMQRAGIPQAYAQQQGLMQAKDLVGTKQTPYEMSDAELFPGEDQATAAPGLMNKGTGLIGGELTPQEFYGGLLSTPGYQQIGAQGLSSFIPQQPSAPKPTSLMQNIGQLHAQGTPEYKDLMRQAIMKPQTKIDMGNKYISGAEAQMMRNAKQEMPPIGMTHAQAAQAGFGFIDKEAEKKAREREETLGSMEHSLDTYETILKKQGAMNVGQMFTKPAEYSKLKAAYGDLLLETKELAKLGVLAGPDMDLMEQLMIDPTSIKANLMQFTANKDELPKQLSIIRSKLTQARKRAEQQYGKNWRTQARKTVKFEDLP